MISVETTWAGAIEREIRYRAAVGGARTLTGRR
jgi:hypothetical protein